MRDCYVRDGRRTLIATDRISAFDVVLGTIPFKGQVLNQMAAFWFEATADLVAEPRHQRPRSRGHGGARMPAAAGRVRHARVPDRRHVDVDLDALLEGRPHVLRPRAARGHAEEPAAAQGDPDAVDQGREGRARRVGVARRDPRAGRPRRRPTSTAPPRCARACSRSASRRRCAAGLILVDTKYEIGRRPDGTLCFIDEVHTPDSSRYWYADDYDARFARGEEPRGLDKEYVRRTLADQGYKGDGPPPTLTRRRARRGGPPLHPGVRARHRPAVRPEHRRAERPHPQEPEARLSGRRTPHPNPLHMPLRGARGPEAHRSASIVSLSRLRERVRVRGLRAAQFAGVVGLVAAEGAEGAAHARRAAATVGEQSRQLGQRLRDRDRLDGSGWSSFSSSSISPAALAPSQLRSTARRRRASSTPNSAARSTLVSTFGLRRRAVDAEADERPTATVATGARAAPGPPGARLAREDLVQQLARRGVEPQELDAHAVGLLRRGRIERLDPGDLAVARERDLAARELDLEREGRSDRQRRPAGDEHAAARDVGRELVDEGVERREAESDTDGGGGAH